MTVRKPLLRADWVNALFIHFRVDPASLAEVPMELDRFDGSALVSLVAFTQQRLRPTVGGRLAAWISGPLAQHEFLNVRTYVRAADGTAGIFFLAEWIPNRIAALIGPRTYGLPYRLGSLRYGIDPPIIHGDVSAGEGRLSFRAEPMGPSLSICEEGTLDHFLLERYTAFTHRRGITRRFDVAHAPWPQTRARVELTDTSLLPASGAWWRGAKQLTANYSPGVFDVGISAPRRVGTLMNAN